MSSLWLGVRWSYQGGTLQLSSDVAILFGAQCSELHLKDMSITGAPCLCYGAYRPVLSLEKGVELSLCCTSPYVALVP